MRRIATITLLLGAFGAAPATADDTIGEVADPTAVDAWAGRQIWSVRDAATGHFRLMTRTSSAASALPVPQRRTPFDVDLGPGPDGSTVAAYSRGGALYAYDFGSGRERALGVRGRLPSVWRGNLAWTKSRHLFVRKRAGGPAREVRGGRGDHVAIDLHASRVAFVRIMPHGE